MQAELRNIFTYVYHEYFIFDIKIIPAKKFRAAAILQISIFRREKERTTILGIMKGMFTQFLQFNLTKSSWARTTLFNGNTRRSKHVCGCAVFLQDR